RNPLAGRRFRGQGFWSHLRSFVTTTRPKPSSKLNPQSVSLALTADNRPFVAGARAKSALSVALDDGGVETGDFAGLASSADTFAGWISSMKAEFRKTTGGGRPATPARPS
ncbi:hypothetical protein, partial [Brevundimonas sp.]|uniref:hypothetical protein n=1 Tax=Brevundimonas sp. TaxID=1871086 RepID=UPI003562EB4A